MITDEQAIQLKKQILEYIEKNFPEDKRDEAKRKIATLNNSQLEEFIKQNQNFSSQEETQSPFRLIVSGKIPYYSIGSSEKALAVLEINPISPGHSIIIPKKPVKEEIPKEILKFAEEISKKIKKRLKPKKILVQEKEVLGEKIVDLVPVYKDENFNSDRSKADEEELKKIQGELNEEKMIKKPKKEEIKVKKEEKLWLPKRIP